ncbi:MAG: acyl-CoA thioesterase [Acetobacteraceae bacterium]
MTSDQDLTRRDAYPLWARDMARYGDTDANGHLNNAVFSTFLETGRITFLLDPKAPLAPPGHGFAIVRLVMDYRAEMHWGGDVEIGTGVLRIGRTSFSLGQAIFQDGQCTATAESVMVLMDLTARRAAPVEGVLRAALEKAALNTGRSAR